MREDRRREREVHERHRETAAKPDRLEREHDRVEQERDQRRDQEQEDRVAHRLSQHPREEHQQGQPDELNPAWNLDRRRAGRSGHRADRTARDAAPPTAAWTASRRRSRASARHRTASPVDPGQRPGSPSGTVLPMSPPSAPGRSARSRRHRHDVRRRRLAVVAAIARRRSRHPLFTAFGGGDHPTATITAPASAARLLPAGPPALKPVARLGTLMLQLPVNQSRITAIGFYAPPTGPSG